MLKWNVYIEEADSIIEYNIFNHGNFLKDLFNMFKNILKEEKKYCKENNLSGLISLKDANKYQKYMDNYEDKSLESICKYNFQGRSEYEIILTTWTPSIDRKEIYRLVNEDKNHIKDWGDPAYLYTPNLYIAEKISIYDQLKLNWGAFKEYVFIHEKDIKKEYRKIMRYLKK